MSHAFSKPVLVCNDQSGSHDAQIEQQLIDMLAEAGMPLLRRFCLPDDDLPDAAWLTEAGADVLIVWTGDGTINAAAGQAEGWAGAMLPLPGGTLNLLSKKLHGDRTPPDILRDVLSDIARRQRIAILQSSERIALITILAGPATQWAEVRETMRQDGVISATREAPEALDAMLNAAGVSLGGNGRVGGDAAAATYPAIILTPTDDGIEAHGVLADGVMDIMRHGLAWLAGDFRDGPSEFLAKSDRIELVSTDNISMEFDGELMEIPSPATFHIGRSALDFIVTS